MGSCLHTYNVHLIYLFQDFHHSSTESMTQKGSSTKSMNIAMWAPVLHTNFHLIPFKDFHHLSTESTTQKGSSTKSMNIATWAPIHTNVHF